MSLNIYLTFDGNCREVFDVYRAVFGGEFQAFQTFAQGPEDMQVAEEENDNVMHVSLPVGDSVLMGATAARSDRPLLSATISRSQSKARVANTATRSSPSCQTAAP